MKKLLTALFCTLVIAAPSFAEELSYEIDPVATAKAPWAVGQRIVKKGVCEREGYYREFLGITQSGFALVQDFYLSSEKFSDPVLMGVTTTEEDMNKSCAKGIEGIYTLWYKNGHKRAQSNFKNGEVDGLVTGWYENGQKQTEANLKNGKLEGSVASWYKNGQKQMEMNYKNNKLEGLLIQWYENGTKLAEGSYKNGQTEGIATGWYENEQKKSECNFKNNKEVGICRLWDEKGNLIREEDFGAPKD